jgi:hypothetical protein
MITVRRSLAAVGLMTMAAAGLIACDNLANPDRIRIAKLDNTYITRGDLFKLINDMEDADRPKIKNKNDLLRVLNQYIDARIKLPVGKQLADQGKVKISRDQAREQFFSESGDNQEELRAIWNMQVPANGEITPLMKLYDLTPQVIRARKDYVEQQTDKIIEKLQAEQAVAVLTAEAYKGGQLQLEDADLEREYRIRKDTLKKLEWMKFAALRFPAATPSALEFATQLRGRINAGESFDAIFQEYATRGDSAVLQPAVQSASPIESEIENNPALSKFRGFWEAASGSQAGDVIGPVYLPEYQQMTQDAQGRSRAVNMPDAYLVLKVLEHRPETDMTLDEAKPQLALTILIAKEMARLRKEHGVEIYEDKLPDPAKYQDQFQDPMAGL